MKNIILYVGGFGFPSRTASAQRARENARLFKSLGYEVVLMGKVESSAPGEAVAEINHCDIDGFDCFDIRHPNQDKQYPSYVTAIESICAVIARYGADNIYAIVAYNYPPQALRQLILFAHAKKIKMVAECTEWHGWEGPKIIRNILRFFQTEYRMRILARRAGNLICASQYACNYYSDCHTVALPFVIDVTEPNRQRQFYAHRLKVRHLVRQSQYPKEFSYSLEKILHSFLKIFVPKRIVLPTRLFHHE